MSNLHCENCGQRIAWPGQHHNRSVYVPWTCESQHEQRNKAIANDRGNDDQRGRS